MSLEHPVMPEKLKSAKPTKKCSHIKTAQEPTCKRPDHTNDKDVKI